HHPAPPPSPTRRSSDLEVARAAHAAGARLANHARVTGLLGDGQVTGAAVTDEMTGQAFEVRARAVVSATGIWAERVAELAGGSRSEEHTSELQSPDHLV